MNVPEHPHSKGWFHLPEHHAKELIAHAIRKIPNAQRLLLHLHEPKSILGQGLPKHKYTGGHLEWAYMNN